MKRHYELLVIDPQNDFCDVPASHSQGNRPALPVAGAHADMLRIAELIRQAGSGLGGITLTLDSHQRMDIAHPTFWLGADDKPVPPFTQITAAQVKDRIYRSRDPRAHERALAYLQALEGTRRYTHMVWPIHCEIGTWGHCVHANVRAATLAWEAQTGRVPHVVVKGTNPWTEHYSAVMAEVPVADDEATLLNQGLLDRLAAADRIFICGEAASHCVKATTEHLAQHLPGGATKLVLLADCMSPVAGFEDACRGFLEAMRSQGARIATTAEVLPELRYNAHI